MSFIYLSFHNEDKDYAQELKTSLKPLQNAIGFQVWDSSMIHAGRDWQNEMAEAMSKASFFLMLVSPEYIANDLNYRELEIASLFSEKTITIYLRSCEIEYTSLAQNSCVILPSLDKPVAGYKNRDEIWHEIVQEIVKIIESTRIE